MDFRPVEKPGSFTVSPNLEDYAHARATFDLDEVREQLDVVSGTPFNIAYLAVDRHASGLRRNHVALRMIGKKGNVRDITYGELAEETSRFASALRSIGVGRGDRVFVLANRVPELYFAALGTIKNGSVFAPLFFTALGLWENQHHLLANCPRSVM